MMKVTLGPGMTMITSATRAKAVIWPVAGMAKVIPGLDQCLRSTWLKGAASPKL
jgi:hypothetical protein